MTFRVTTVQRLYSIDPSNAIRAQIEVTREKQLPAPLFPASIVFDYPNPRGYIHPSDLRNFIQSQIPPAAAVNPFSNYNQPNPYLAVPSPSQQLGTLGALLGLTASQAELTFNRVYDNPVRKTWDVNLYSFTQNIAPTNPIPANVTNWPNPPGAIFPSSNLAWTALGFTELEAGIVLVPAEANYDWPVPQGYRYPSDLRTFVQNTSQSLKSLVQVPLVPFDWPNPTLKTWTPAPVVFANALQVLALQPPLKRENWPNPVLAIAPIDRLGFENNYSDILLGLISPPISQTDWPNPRGYTFPSDLRFWSQTIIAAEDTPPRGNYNQPNPTLARWASDNLTFIAGISRELAAAVNIPPNTTYDRPNPYGPISEIGIKIGQSYSIPLTLLTFTPTVTTGQHNRYFFADMGSMWSNR